MLFLKGEVPKQVEYGGIMVDVVKTTVLLCPDGYERVEKIQCPVCKRAIYYKGFISHLSQQTRNSDIGHAKMYFLFMKKRGQKEKAINNFEKWLKKHKQGLTIMKKIMVINNFEKLVEKLKG